MVWKRVNLARVTLKAELVAGQTLNGWKSARSVLRGMRGRTRRKEKAITEKKGRGTQNHLVPAKWGNDV